MGSSVSSAGERINVKHRGKEIQGGKRQEASRPRTHQAASARTRPVVDRYEGGNFQGEIKWNQTQRQLKSRRTK